METIDGKDSRVGKKGAETVLAGAIDQCRVRVEDSKESMTNGSDPGTSDPFRGELM